MRNFPVALIDVRETTWQQHLKKLKSKRRNFLFRMQKSCIAANYKIIHLDTNLYSIEEMYSFYVYTHNMAAEYKRKIIPISFFHEFIELENSVLSLLLDENNKMLAFSFSLVNETAINPFLFGKDAHSDLKANAYYNLLLSILERYVDGSIQYIDLGITNYYMKQNFGIFFKESDLYIKINNRFYNQLFGKLASKIFDVPPPDKRDVFTQPK